ncbi:MAG: AMIN domain-containing protein, partial [Campylobacterales bacterium]|nr:AMIN domain-containing protein [Campylobacterales bacterium]
KDNKNSIFSKIRVGNHAGYYRAVIELDGLYRYNMQKIPDGYILNLR